MVLMDYFHHFLRTIPGVLKDNDQVISKNNHSHKIYRYYDPFRALVVLGSQHENKLTNFGGEYNRRLKLV